MKTLLFYLLQVIVSSAILYGYYHLALRNKKFHRYNRFYLLASFVISIIVPFFNIPVYFTNTDTDSSFILHTITSFSTSGVVETPVTISYSPNVKTTWFTWQHLSYSFYIVIASIVMIRILFSLKNIRRIIRKNPVEKIKDIHFINTDEPGTPFSFFSWLFWNRQIELHSEKGEQIFRHELFHIQQRHSRDIIFMELMMVTFWINPFFHLIKKEVKAIHEFLADQFAVKENQHWEYAELLLMQALATKQHLVNPFFHNQIKRRIAMITSSSKPRLQYLRKLMLLPIAAIVFALFAFAYKTKREEQAPAENFKEIKSPDRLRENSTNGELSIGINDTANNGADVILKNVSFIDKNGKRKYLTNVPVRVYGIDKKDTSKPLPENILFVIDGKKQPDIKSFVELENKVSVTDISSINVLKGAPAISKYGNIGMSSVIEIYTKNKNETRLSDDPNNKIFDKVEIEPSFPGGNEKWKQYLAKNANDLISLDKEAPQGSYAVVIQFVVDTTGYIYDLRPLTKHGYGMEEKAIFIITKGPKWIPAIQNGHKVKAYRKQPIIFTVTGEDKTSQINISQLNEVVVVGYQEEKGRYTKLPKDAKPPSFVGGENEWRKYLERNINSLVAVDNGAPAGTYTTMTQFLVKADGSTSKFKSLTNQGYGMEEEALRVIQSAKQWEPVIVNSEKVNAYKKQPVTFIVENDKSIPKITKKDFLKSSVNKLLDLNEETEILSYGFAIYFPNGVAETKNKGSLLSNESKMLLNRAEPGTIFSLNYPRIIKDGKEMSASSKIYRLAD